MSSPQNQTMQDLQVCIEKVASLYGTKINDISSKISEGINNKFNEIKDDAEKAKEFVDTLKDIFAERKKAIDARSKLLDSKAFTYDVQKHPEKISVKKELSESRSVTTPRREKLSQLMIESAKTQDLIDMNQTRLKSLLVNGCDLSKEEQTKLANLRTLNDKFISDVGKTAISMVSEIVKTGNEGVNQIGRGIFSKGEAGKSKFVDKYRKILDGRIKKLRNSIDLNQSKYAKTLEARINALQASQDPLEIAACDALEKELQKEIEADAKEYQAALDKLDKDVSGVTKEMMEKVQSNIDQTDEQWKYRALSMFLIFTPLGAFSIAGHVFNYLDPLVEIFGPIFEAHKSLGEGFADAITSKQFGFLGEMMDKMEIDKAVETIIDKTPILSNFTEIINYLTDSEIAQNAGMQFAPMLDSPLTLIAIAVSYNISRAPVEINLMKSQEANRMKYLGGTEVGIFPSDHGFDLTRVKKSAVDEKFDAFEKNIVDGWKRDESDGSKTTFKGFKSKSKAIVDKELEISEDAYIDCRAAKFVLDAMARPESITVINTIAPNLVEQCQKGVFNNSNGQPDINLILRNLNADQAAKKSLREAFLTICGIDADLIKDGVLSKSVAQVLADFADLNQENNPQKTAEKQKAQSDATTALKKEFYFDKYRASGGNIGSRSDEDLENAKSDLKLSHLNFYSDSLEKNLPPTSVKPTAANLLQPQRQQAQVS